MCPLINSRRLWNEIHETAKWGAIPGTNGLSRLALSPSDKCVRDWFIDKAKEVGCEVTVDEIGNIFATLAGRDNTLPPIGIGSHLDTQPRGGRFDGILGTIGALEVLRFIKENGIENHRPITAINWTNEEGASFESGCTGSAVWAGYIPLETAYAMETIGGQSTLLDELCNIGYRGAHPADAKLNPLCAHFELHIEQGPRLEQSGKKIAAVTGIQGNRRVRVVVHGEKAHAGSTPMLTRTDALVASSRLILDVEESAVRHGGFATVGIIECMAGSINCVPGEVSFVVDMRHPLRKSLDEMELDLFSAMQRLRFDRSRLRFDIVKLWESPATIFDDDALECVRRSARSLVGDEFVTELCSFAGHDSAMTNLQVPTVMIFVPSKDGISHAPEEYTPEDQCADGVQVLADAVIAYDLLLSKRTSRKDSGVACVTP
ncbi:amidase [Xylariaceae sp. AK1471]|nr:amidase [Xylariaceae sp. AK1471]